MLVVGVPQESSEDDGTYKNLQDYPQPDISFAKDWTHVVSANNGLFFFYNDTNGSAQAGGMTISGIYEKLQAYLENTFNVGWTNIVSRTRDEDKLRICYHSSVFLNH